MPEPIASSETKKDDGWSDSDAETEMTAKVSVANGDGDSWGDSDDENQLSKQELLQSMHPVMKSQR